MGALKQTHFTMASYTKAMTCLITFFISNSPETAYAKMCDIHVNTKLMLALQLYEECDIPPLQYGMPSGE